MFNSNIGLFCHKKFHVCKISLKLAQFMHINIYFVRELLSALYDRTLEQRRRRHNIPTIQIQYQKNPN